MADDPKLTVIPTAQDQMAGDFENITRLWRLMAENAQQQLALTRKALFDAYINAGFTEAQALDLCSKSMTI